MAVEFGNRETFVGGCMLLGATAGGGVGFGASVMGGPTLALSPMLTVAGAASGGIAGYYIGTTLADQFHMYSKGSKSSSRETTNEGFKKQVENYSDKSLRKSCKSLQDRLTEHFEKINYDPTNTAMNHWKHEIKVFQEQLEIVKKEMMRRGL